MRKQTKSNKRNKNPFHYFKFGFDFIHNIILALTLRKSIVCYDIGNTGISGNMEADRMVNLAVSAAISANDCNISLVCKYIPRKKHVSLDLFFKFKFKLKNKENLKTKNSMVAIGNPYQSDLVSSQV